MNKLERNGMVAVVYSPGYGAGWSTWAVRPWVNRAEVAEGLAMHEAIAGAVDLGFPKEDIKRIATELFPGCYLGAVDDGLVIAWVPKGEAFEITEYDGGESVTIISLQKYMIA